MSAEAPLLQIEIIRVINPFDPRDHLRETLAWSADKTLADFFPIGSASAIVSINGKIIEADSFPVTYLAPGDHIVTCPIPIGGGKGSKNTVAIIAMIAVAVVAPQIALAMGPSLGLLAGSVGMSMLTVGISMAGSMLVGAMMSPSSPTEKKATEKASSSYGIDGAKNSSAEGIPLPVLYGEYRMAGNVINLFVENDGASQILYVRLAVSEGPINYIGDIEFNDQPITNFTEGGILADARTGTSSQSVMGWFGETVTPHYVGTKLTTGYTFYTTGSIDEFRVDLSATSGLFSVDAETGAVSNVDVDFEILYSVQGAGTYFPIPGVATPIGTRRAIPTYTAINPFFHPAPYYGGDVLGDGSWTNEGTIVSWRWAGPNEFNSEASYASEASGQTITNPAAIAFATANTKTIVDAWGNLNIDVKHDGLVCADIPVYDNRLRMSDGKRNAVRKSFRSGQLPRGAYDIAIKRLTADSVVETVSDDVYITDINEIQYDDLAMPYTAMLGVKMRLYEQLSGLPKITFLARGVSMHVNRLARNANEPAGRNWYYEYSVNPAWIIWDILTNTRYGGGMKSDRLDLIAFQDFADYCDTERLFWNGPIDSQVKNVWDAVQLVARVGHGQLVGKGTGYTLVIERAATPVMMFSVANMIEGTFKETWLPVADRANEIEVTYFDRLDNYKQRTIKVYDPTALSAGRPARNSAVTLYGVTDYDRAYKEGLFQLNLNRYILQTVEFGAPLEALACTVGSLVYVQHDMPQWGYAGRLETGSTASVLNFDRSVSMVTGTSYKALVLHDALQRTSGLVSSVVGTSVFLTNFNGALPVKRF